MFWNWGRYTGGSKYPGGSEVQWRLVMLQVVYVTNYGRGRGPESKKGGPRSRPSRFSFLPLPLILPFTLPLPFFFFLYRSARPGRVTAEILNEGIPARPRLIENLVLAPAGSDIRFVNLSRYRREPLRTRHPVVRQGRIAFSRNNVNRSERFSIWLR